MFRGIVAGVATLLASAPASAVVVFERTGVLEAGDWVSLDFYGQPRGTPEHPNPFDGHYRITFESEALADRDIKSCDYCEFYMTFEKNETWIEYKNWNIVDSGDGLSIINAIYNPFSSFQQYSFDFRQFEKNIDSEGNGYASSYNALFNFYLRTKLETPAEYTYRIERFTLPPVPEPATWAMMIAGLGMAGAAIRRRRASVIPA